MSAFNQQEIHAWEANVNIPCVPCKEEVPVDGDLVMCPLDDVKDLKMLEVDTSSASGVLETTILYRGYKQRLAGVCYVANSKLALDGHTDNTSPALMTVAITGVTTPWNLSSFPWQPCQKLIVGPAAIVAETGLPLIPRGKTGMGNTTLWPAHPYVWDGDFMDGVAVHGYINEADFVELVRRTAPFTLMPLYARAAADVVRNVGQGTLHERMQRLMAVYVGNANNAVTMDNRLPANSLSHWIRQFLRPEWMNYVRPMTAVQILEAYFMMMRCQMEFQSVVHTLQGERGRVKLRF